MITPCHEDTSLPGARLPGRRMLPLLPFLSFCLVGAEIASFVRRRLTPRGVMLAGQARLERGSMQACHEAINNRGSLAPQWRVSQLKGQSHR